ncbi:MAG: WYL domain-containing protein [Bacteroidia bacterium]|nr:WYL domain-containing protein [Bacteroidota bacterium]MBP6412073.1 WYL domain-containing protein [Bacteroidia bacterium]
MAKSKDQFLRFRIIDEELRRKDWVKTSDIKTRIEGILGESVSVRTIQKDIEAMQNDSRLGYYAPIENDTRRKAHSYTDKAYSILNFRLMDAELSALTFYASSINLYKDYGIFKDFSNAIQKVVDAVSLKARLKDDVDPNLIIQTDNNSEIKGCNFLTSLVQAILDSKIIKFTYKKFMDKNAKEWTFKPHLLKEYKSRWYIIGYDLKDNIKTFALDRIENVELTENFFIKNQDFNHNLYFKNSFGINRADNKKIEKILLKYTPHQSNYVESLAIHPTQQTIKKAKDGSLTISIEVVPSYELFEYLLGQADSVKIISPKFLAKDLKERHEKAQQQYN